MKKSLLVAFSILLLSACTTTRLSDEAMGTLIEDFIASEQIENRHSVSAFTLDSYGELNDEYVIFRSAPMRHYLIKLAPRWSELSFSMGLVLHRRFGNTLSEGLDYVYVPDSLPFKCFINKIYPLTKAQHDALRNNIKAEITELKLKEEHASDSETPEPAAE